jgi:hypothetical protein
MHTNLQSSATHSVLPIVLSTLTLASAFGQTIEFTWTSAGEFHGTPGAGTVVTTFSSSAPFNLTEFRSTYTGMSGGTRISGPFEITAATGDTLSGYSDLTFPPLSLMNVGSGTFMFTAGTGQFAGATGQGTMDVTTILPSIPTTIGDVIQEWRGMITLVPATVPGDYNQNGTVDAADYVQWRNGGPLQNDSTPGVQPEDYTIWRANFGRTAASGAAVGPIGVTGVPEPAASVLALLAVAAKLLRKHRGN